MVVSKETLAKILEWQKNNPEKRKQYIKNYHEKHKEKEKEYYLKNRDKIILRNKKYRQLNKNKLNKQARERRKDPVVKLKHTISCHIRHSIRDGKKVGPCMNYLQYSIADLKTHLESQFEDWMTWDNWGVYNLKEWNDNNPSTWKWQIDHIIPQSELVYDSMEHPNFKKCWALKNLRPLNAKQNILSGAKLCRYNVKK